MRQSRLTSKSSWERKLDLSKKLLVLQENGLSQDQGLCRHLQREKDILRRLLCLTQNCVGHIHVISHSRPKEAVKSIHILHRLLVQVVVDQDHDLHQITSQSLILLGEEDHIPSLLNDLVISPDPDQALSRKVSQKDIPRQKINHARRRNINQGLTHGQSHREDGDDDRRLSQRQTAMF